MANLRLVSRPTRQPAPEPFLADLARVLDLLDLTPARDAAAAASLESLRLAVTQSRDAARRQDAHAELCQCEACGG